jgi:hypothetical protein
MISEREWASIAEMIDKITQKTAGRRHFITGVVVKRDVGNQLVWIKELGAQPIPVVAFNHQMKYYDEAVASVALSGAPAVTNRTITQQILSTVAAGATYTRPANCIALVAELVGGGGAGGGAGITGAAQASAGGGGSGGNYSKSIITSPSATYTYTVPAGGTGVSAAAGNNGNDALFGTLVAKGGVGGDLGAVGSAPTAFASSNGSAPQASGNVGDFIVLGEAGQPGLAVSASLSDIGGAGGNSVFGGGALATRSIGSAGNAGGNYGGGGSGGVQVQNNASGRAGGNGGNGLIIVTEYYSLDVALGSISATPSTQVKVKNSAASTDVPNVGDTVLIALELGDQSIPRCLGVVKGTNWITSEES